MQVSILSRAVFDGTNFNCHIAQVSVDGFVVTPWVAQSEARIVAEALAKVNNVYVTYNQAPTVKFVPCAPTEEPESIPPLAPAHST